MKHPLWYCQSCGENIGIIGRFLFPWFHKCKLQEDYGTQSSSHNKARDAIALCKDLAAVNKEFLCNPEFSDIFIKRAQCIVQQHP